MKKIIKISSYVIILFIFSCSSDDDSGGNTGSGINVQNLVTNFDENPAVNDIVGTIQASSGNTLSFSITSQTPSGALSINPSTGELSVADASAFDFETNPVISAMISIIDPNSTASATATINLNNLDDIASFLSTSEAAYTAAADGDWVMITETEYNALANNLNNISKIATTDGEYTPSSPILLGVTATIVNDNGVTIPANSLVFAIKYWALNDTASGIKIKQSSTSASSGYSDLGGTISSNNTGTNYRVLKGNNTAVTAEGYLAIYDPAGDDIGSSGAATGSNVLYDAGDSTMANTAVANVIVYYQGLSTTQKQW